MKNYLRAIGYLRACLFGTVVGSVFLFLSLGTQLFRPWPVKWAIDWVLKDPGSFSRIVIAGASFSRWEAIAGASLLLVTSAFLGAWAKMMADRYFLQSALQALVRLRIELFSRLQELSLPFHRSRPTGDLIYRVVYDTQAIQTVLQRGIVTVLTSFLTLVGALALLFRLNQRLAWVALGIVPPLAAAVRYFAERIRRETEKFHRRETQLLSETTEVLHALPVVQAYNLDQYRLELFRQHAEQSQKTHTSMLLTSSLSNLVLDGITSFGTALLLFLGAREVLEHRVTVGDLWVFLSYVGLLYRPLEEMGYTAWALEGASAGLGRVFEVMDIPDPVPDRKDAHCLPRVLGRIEFRDVTFAYEPDCPVLNHIHLEIPAKTRVGIVGPSGAGKTTILALIARFYDPQEGSILLDGIDLRSVKKRSLRNQLAFVLQETTLFTGTVEENIACGHLGASPEEVRAAARWAQAEPFILRLPYGYRTQIGERGTALSGGERQRIGLARAFLRDAPILLLDEPTSALDPHTERELLLTLRQLQKDRTTVLVTHRLALVHDMDWIYVLKEGRIVEEGQGEDLLRRGGLYAEFWKKAIQRQESLGNIGNQP
ncbi:ABC transporter ATP-binding protein [Candidatus Methylacidithermus pantelleriae]|uniref:ATP-binding cassette, subfamily B/ATP-binding cassette, subfamily B, MsbA n=1 Tax=Candidatus Methylacidithermus pantelleriae TaxID=2744239 RepID=A0A8J2BNF5_9BACT|nr:ABC transporter ATP-binding protein [Candidatus Methylacidithermus pantelleriae]CAF0698653.1 ATP-binding cassette, subfamily B/ATP-binding cassette, subfamily B, MsbA [Candidatus Methylacidithermus pantelleriae]